MSQHSLWTNVMDAENKTAPEGVSPDFVKQRAANAAAIALTLCVGAMGVTALIAIAYGVFHQ